MYSAIHMYVPLVVESPIPAPEIPASAPIPAPSFSHSLVYSSVLCPLKYCRLARQWEYDRIKHNNMNEQQREATLEQYREQQ